MESEFEKYCGDGSDEACDLKDGRVDAAYLRRVQVSAWNAALSAVEAKMPGPCPDHMDIADAYNLARNAVLAVLEELRSPAPPVEPRQPAAPTTPTKGHEPDLDVQVWLRYLASQVARLESRSFAANERLDKLEARASQPSRPVERGTEEGEHEG